MPSNIALYTNLWPSTLLLSDKICLTMLIRGVGKRAIEKRDSTMDLLFPWVNFFDHFNHRIDFVWSRSNRYTKINVFHLHLITLKRPKRKKKRKEKHFFPSSSLVQNIEARATMVMAAGGNPTRPQWRRRRRRRSRRP